MSLLGIDIGPTGCKAIIFSASGKVLVSEYKNSLKPNVFHKQNNVAEKTQAGYIQADQQVFMF